MSSLNNLSIFPSSPHFFFWVPLLLTTLSFHHAFLQATAMHLFRDDIDVDLARVMHQNNWKSLKQQCLCMTPRRFGKVSICLYFILLRITH